jgi:hypothetical protein
MSYRGVVDKSTGFSPAPDAGSRARVTAIVHDLEEDTIDDPIEPVQR